MIDPAAFLRLDAPNTLGTTATGASFATSTGDVLEVSCYGPGVFRLRAGPNTRPDYGIVTGRVKPRKCRSVIDPVTVWPFHNSRNASGDPASSSVESPDVNVHVSGAACATVHGLTRPVTMP